MYREANMQCMGPRVTTRDTVMVECDRCRRPVASLHPVGAEVMPRGTMRPGALVTRRVLPGSDYPSPGWRLECAGRKHPAQHRMVAVATLRAAYDAAIAAGRTRVSMWELTRPRS